MQKLHAAVARKMREADFEVKNVQKRLSFGALVEAAMSKKVHAVVARSAFRSQKCTKHFQLRSTFKGCDVEKVHAIVARSTFRSQNVQNTLCSGHFRKLRCRKSARRCGPKHISKSKMLKSTTCSDHFWMFRCRLWIVHLVKSEQNVRVFKPFQKTMAGVGTF